MVWTGSCYGHPGENDEELSTVGAGDKIEGLQQVSVEWVRASEKPDVNSEAKQDPWGAQGWGVQLPRTRHEF